MTTWSDVFAFLWHELTVPRISLLAAFVALVIVDLIRVAWRAWKESA